MNTPSFKSFRRLAVICLLLLPLHAAGAEAGRVADNHEVLENSGSPRSKRNKGVDDSVGNGPDNMPRQASRDRRLSDNMLMAFDGEFHCIASQEGIDVSHYQGRIDWGSVAREGKVSYVYAKATEGANFYDDTHTYNITEARRAGVKVGSYHFYRPTVDIALQFDNLTAHVHAREQDLVPMIDIEDDRGVSEEKFIKDLTAFLQMVENHYGKKPLLYSGEYFYNRHFQGLFQDYHWMMARYSSTPPTLKDGRTYFMWQYSDKGRISGISNPVDRSRMIGNVNLKTLKM